MSTSEVIKNGLCYMCTSNCPSIIHVSNGKATKIDRPDTYPAVGCPRFNAQLDFIYHPERLRYPLKRTGERGDNSFKHISWDEALDTVANNLQKVKDKYGAESVAFWIAYTKEPRPYFHRLTHAFGSPNYCTESSSCASSAALACYVTYGMRQISFQSPSKCAIIWGSSIVNSRIALWPKYIKAKNEGLKLIVVDPCYTKIASLADIHLQLRPGTDGALALGMINIIIKENLYDKEFIEQWTIGFDDLKKLIIKYSPEYVEEITRVPASKIREAALLFATQKPAEIVMSVNSTTHHTNGVQNHRAIIILPAITGNIKVPKEQYSQHIPLMNDITLHQMIKNMPPGVGSEKFPIWTQLTQEMQSNVLADQIDSGNPYPIKALFSAGLNVQFFPNSKRTIESLKKLDFIAVTEYFQTPGTRLADIVLPIASWIEREILYGTRSGHVRLIEPAIEPVGESWPEWKIYSELAKRLGFGDLFWDGDFGKCINYMLEPLGITYEYLKNHPEGTQHTIGAHSEISGFPTQSGKIEIASSILAKYGLEPLPKYNEPQESPISQPDLAICYPLIMTSGARVLAYTHSQFRNIDRLRKLVPEPLVDINPIDASVREISQGDTVVISTPRGSIKMKANITDSILAGVVSLPHHWPDEANVNILVDDKNLDPISGFPPFKSQLCQVSRL